MLLSECGLESSLNVSDEGGDLGWVGIDLWLTVTGSVLSQILSLLLGLEERDKQKKVIAT